jgi:tetratricopeptide (TPR) repeat protein
LSSSGDSAGAEALYTKMLETAENAEASYELGEIYSAQGDIYKARAAWRRAIRTDSNYQPARIRLNIM